MCNETLIILILITLLTIIIYMMYMKKKEQIAENFAESTTIQTLLEQYQALTNEEKEQLAQAIGLPAIRDNMIHKSAIPPQRECPASKYNDLDYVKRSSIPPCPEPKPCIAPKVVVDADLCKEHVCPPCPSVPECAKVETVQVPVMIQKTVVVNEDGEEISTTVEQSDIELGEEYLESGTPDTETQVENPETEPETEPEGSETVGDLLSRLFLGD
jgi:competence protein ComGC